jgi:AraC family transcriptional regulator
VFRKATSLTPGQYRELCCTQIDTNADHNGRGLRTD